MDFDKITYKLADKQATDVILNDCEIQIIEGIVWRDVDRVKHGKQIAWEIKYLRTRGLLSHHPLIPNLVIVRSPHEAKTK